MNESASIKLNHAYWAAVSELPVFEIKEALITGYRSGAPFSSHVYHFFSRGARAHRTLDFGCGIGRNFPSLRQVSNEIVAYDLPGMINACRRYAHCEGITLCDDWSLLEGQRFDVGIATLVFQHIEDNATRLFFLRQLSKMCDFLYVSSRCWIDGPDHPNIAHAITDSGYFSYIKGTLSENEALEVGYPEERHLELLLRTTDTESKVDGNEKLFDLEDIEYTPSSERFNLTLTQLFTPNYDHWAPKVLANKRAYCDEHGYRFHYRRGLYEYALDRHPSWHRIPLILELFEAAETEWVFWSDIDSLIMRTDVPLDWILAKYPGWDLIVPNQGAGLHLGESIDNCLCFGQFFLRNCLWSRRFLRELWEFPLNPDFSKFLREESWEQEAVNHFHLTDHLEFSRHAAVVPNRLFNSFYHTQYREGDFLIHFAGDAARGEGRRESLIEEYLGRAPATGGPPEITTGI